MRHYYFCRASRLFAARSVQSKSYNALPAIFSPVFRDQQLAFSRLGSQIGRSYSQTNAPKPSPKSNKTDTHKNTNTPVTPPGRGPDTHARDNRDHSTRLSPPAHANRQVSQSSSSNAFSPPGGGVNLPGSSGGDSLFPSTTSPLLGAALTTIVGLGLGA